MDPPTDPSLQFPQLPPSPPPTVAPPPNLPGSTLNGVVNPDSTSTAVKKRRGRPPKPKHDAVPAAVPVFAHPVDVNDATAADAPPVTAPTPSRGRGRPPKSRSGRPPKVAVTRVATPGSVARGRGRPRKNPRGPTGAVAVFAAPVGVKRRGRPPKAGGVAKKQRKLSGKPVGRPRKAADSQLLVAYLDLKSKLENLQSRVKQTVAFVRPHLNNNDETAIDALQELEYAATSANVASYPVS